eukprot:scaffold116904_cov20-Tisochrysis_lutea.AAC.1
MSASTGSLSCPPTSPELSSHVGVPTCAATDAEHTSLTAACACRCSREAEPGASTTAPAAPICVTTLLEETGGAVPGARAAAPAATALAGNRAAQGSVAVPWAHAPAPVRSVDAAPQCLCGAGECCSGARRWCGRGCAAR